MMGFVVGVKHDPSRVSEFTFDETLEFRVDSLEHVDVEELIVWPILDFIWNGWITVGGLWGGKRGGRVGSEEGLVLVVVGFIPLFAIDDFW